MTAISFIITTYNIAKYIPKCLESIAAVAKAGDQVIVIDDCSKDDTPKIISDYMTHDTFANGVTLETVFLGANTPGGVGTPGNVGLRMSKCETVFFVDGDDWIDVDGFTKARAVYQDKPCDIMFVNYLEYDEAKDAPKHPADQAKWQMLDVNVPFETLRQTALSFIAVPWRKFYNRAFIEEHGLRYPEGDFFFEDNPFHWAVCRAARSIRFLDVVICHHRINRPGQTMASTGRELGAFFTHFDTIRQSLPADDTVMQKAVGVWILNQMSWHLTRLQPQAQAAYFKTAAKSLAQISDGIWGEEIYGEMGHTKVYRIAEQLRDGDVWGYIAKLEMDALVKRVETVEQKLGKLTEDMIVAKNNSQNTVNMVKSIKANLTGAQAITQFKTIKAGLEN